MTRLSGCIGRDDSKMPYSVLTEPVIPVLMLDGNEKRIGIREVFLEAHQIKDISGSNPLERYALLRLLIVFAMDMLHPKTSYERMELLQAGCFDAEILDTYISECEKDGPRFDLFDSEHPFLQSKYNEAMDAKATKPVATILHALPSGNNHTFIDHRLADSHRISIPAAFRALCASYVFCVSGTAGPSSVNNTPPLFAVMIGDNLFNTIVINMVSEAEAAPLPYGEGETPWRSQRVVVPKEQVASVSLLEGLTWMPRRITLIHDEDSDVIENIYCQAGLNFQGNDLWNDPHVPKFRKKDGSFGTVKPELDREVWRDVGSLLYDHDSKQIRQPLAIRNLNNVYDDDELPDWILIRTAGLATNQAAYTGWCESELSIPALLLYDENKAGTFREDVQLIEALQAMIYSTVQRYADKPRSSGTGEEHEIASQSRQYFLKEAHDYLFGADLVGIRNGISETGHNEAFCKSVSKLIQDTLMQVLHAAGNDTDSIIKQLETEKWIWINYHRIMKEREGQYAGS